MLSETVFLVSRKIYFNCLDYFNPLLFFNWLKIDPLVEVGTDTALASGLKVDTVLVAKVSIASVAMFSNLFKA